MTAYTEIDRQHMRRAIELARQGWFTTHPNPRVGCVIAHGEQIVGEGSHLKAGAAHAEVLALRAAGPAAQGATAYVTLEPHSFHGKTPPCTQALIAAGIARVICGTVDPNPKVSGSGIEQLRQAGVDTSVGLLEEESRALNLGFDKRMREGRPRVTLKVAASIDGRVALANGESRWITSEAARADVQRVRASMSAVVTGVQTVLADDPLLNVRDPSIDLGGRALLRVVLDSTLRTPPEARIFSAPGNVLVFTCAPVSERSARLEDAGAQIVRVSADTEDKVDLHAVLAELGRRECNDVLVEAGPILTGRCLTLGLCDELIVYFAPKLLGGDAKAMFELPALQRLNDALQFKLRRSEVIGPDLKVTFVR
jgi:diaminohydroxyphosphoribosylaminopyrimidine deaminase/5-amino-6-(5-phosphoribosylamino)uracil reductase